MTYWLLFAEKKSVFLQTYPLKQRGEKDNFSPTNYSVQLSSDKNCTRVSSFDAFSGFEEKTKSSKPVLFEIFKENNAFDQSQKNERRTFKKPRKATFLTLHRFAKRFLCFHFAVANDFAAQILTCPEVLDKINYNTAL